MSERYDLVIIGGGPAGYMAAAESGAKGKRTALIENRQLGGTCLNRGCIPTKTLLHGAQLYQQMKACSHLGIHAEGVSCRMDEMQEHKEEVLTQLRNGIAALMKKNKVTVYEGTGRILGANQVAVTLGGPAAGSEVGGACGPAADSEAGGACAPAEKSQTGQGTAAQELVLETDKILIATGSVPAMPPIPGRDLPGVMDSDGFLENRELLSSLTIVGGGVIGMEFASLYSALGCQVTVLEFLDRILANMDREISQSLKMQLKKQGVEICTGAQVESISQNEEGGLVCRYVQKGETKEVVSQGVLIATGRRANIRGLFAAPSEGISDEEAAQKLGIRLDRGRIVTDENGQTSLPGVYGAGDVTGGIQLAHAASAQAINAVAHMWGESPVFDTALIPGCVYTEPEIASVGMTQDEAKKMGLEVIAKKYPMTANGKTVLSGQERGFIRVIAERDSRRVLGAQMMCARATDMISEFGLAIQQGLTLEQMAAVVRPHPTFSEAIGEAVRG